MAPPDALEQFRLHAEICKVLTDPKRLLLLHVLRDGERSVGELATELGLSLPNTSQHLAVLRSAELVDGRREGTSVRYRLAEPAILDACDIVEGIVERRRIVRRTDLTASAQTDLAAPTSVSAGN
jgi:ArsR family transcriptional regulator